MSVVEELSGDGSRIVTSWKRTTVADGDWLQHNTIGPLNERDVFLAEKIDELSGNADEKLNEEIEARKNADTFLSGTIDTFSGNYETFKSKTEGNIDYLSGSIDGLKEDLDTEKEDRSREDGLLQDQIDTIKAASDVIMVYGTYNNFETNSASLTLTDNDVIKVLEDEHLTPPGQQVYYQYSENTETWTNIGELSPYYSKAEIDDKETALSSTIANNYLSASTAAVSAGKNILVTKESGPVIGIKTPDEVSFSNLTSTNIMATAIDTTTINAETVNATTTKSTNFSGNTLSGETLYTSIDGLIESATNGGAMTGVKNVSGIKLTHIANQSDYEHNPDDGEFGFSTSADQLTFYVSGGAAEWLKPKVGGNPYGICLTGESIENYLGGKSLNVTADYAYTAATTLDTFTAKTPNNEYVGEINQLYLSAGKGIDFVSGNDGKLTISSEGTTYTTGQYINISNDNKISVTGTLINSAQSGQSAYNWITAQSATLSAGPGIKFTSAGQNTMGITITAGGVGGVITAIAGSALSAGANYTQGRCITIDDQNTINLSSDINLDKQLVINHYTESDPETYTSAYLGASKLDFSGSRDSGGDYRNQSATYRIDYLKIDNYYNADDLHFAYLDESILQLSASTKMAGYTVRTCTNIANDYFEMEWAGSPSVYYLKFNGKTISAGSNSSNVTTAYWSNVIDAATGTWVSGTSNRITIEAPSQTKLVFTASLPPTLDDNTYYIV